ncbi:hypothetical protein QTI66_29030 [Variovorax sp. J22R133]|uniref:hypothetical protein n=1 Tax=Variovorax brevis TaxID=3053503 RepID=UPI002577CC90|nr:hypothetical protein [Variovorax sp. J22R133]MDM0116214.1 hypothetical protein [Variovorax sp. J22R133]
MKPQQLGVEGFMGKALIGVVFIIGFVVFLVAKTVILGTKAAYEAVFDPTAKDDQTKALISDCMLRVSHKMHESYTGKAGELTQAILHLTPMVQSFFFDKGFKVDSAIARRLVCEAIVAGGHASHEEVARA